MAALGVSAATFFHGESDFDFLNGAERIGSSETCFTKNGPGQVEMFNLHEPYEQAWSEAESELCERHGWRLSGSSRQSQIFDYQGKESISIAPGRVNQDLDFLDGTDTTDTYVVIRKMKH